MIEKAGVFQSGKAWLVADNRTGSASDAAVAVEPGVRCRRRLRGAWRGGDGHFPVLLDHGDPDYRADFHVCFVALAHARNHFGRNGWRDPDGDPVLCLYARDLVYV